MNDYNLKYQIPGPENTELKSQDQKVEEQRQINHPLEGAENAGPNARHSAVATVTGGIPVFLVKLVSILCCSLAAAIHFAGAA